MFACSKLRITSNRLLEEPVNRFLRRGLVCVPHLLIFTVLIFNSSWWERDTVVSIDGQSPPTFQLSGNGYQNFLGVSELTPEEIVPAAQRPYVESPTLWEIWPIEGTEAKADNWPPIKYGEVPPGFYQKIPQSGKAPPLQEGKMYEAGGPASNANGGSIWFKIENGKSVEIPKPGGI